MKVQTPSKMLLLFFSLTLVLLSTTILHAGKGKAAGPKAVKLGKAGDFVILTKAGITTTGTTAIIGDIGVSPIAATAMTGFGLITDSSGKFSTSSLVTGKIYAADYAKPTPKDMTKAISDMETAFLDAAARTNPDFTELGGGDISGKTLLPGLHKWSTDVLITSAGVTLAGGDKDVWILQIAGNLTVNNSAMVTLVGGAQAKNVFWQVSGKTTLGTAADVKGIILSKTLISMNTGAVLCGRALAQTAVTLIANTVTDSCNLAPQIDIDHYEILHDGHGLTCQPEAITIKACTDTLSPCTESTNASTLTLGTNIGNWLESNPLSFTGSTSVNLRNTSTAPATISLSGTNPSAATQCYENGTLESPCTLIFHDSGFIFDVLDAASGSTQTVSMQAVRLNDINQKCVPLFQGNKLINFNFAYTTPNSNPNSSQAVINSNNFSANALTETLFFDTNGATDFTVSYPDAGKLTFNASYDDGEAFALGTDTAIFYPAEFRITADGQLWSATDENSLILAHAGANFSLTIQALNTLGNITPNYSGTPILSATNVGPAGGATGTLGTGNVSLTGGTATLTDQTYDEVGIMTITANDLDYQGYSINGTSANIGRFVPDSFRVLSAKTGTLTHADGTFSYFGHEIIGYAALSNPSFTIEALADDGLTRTVNYQGAFFKMTEAGLSITSPTTDKILTSQPLSITRAGDSLNDNSNGTATYDFGADKTTYTRSATATVPLLTPQFDFSVTQISDGETTSAVSEAIPVSGGTELRYGRLRIENSFGPETEPINLPVSTEYWDSGLWQTNSIDSSSAYTYTKVENDITTTEDESGTPVSPTISTLTLAFGSDPITLTTATDPNDPGGTVDLTPGVPNWLKFDWDDELGTPDTDPTATATFGIYRGRDRIISWEEIPAH